MAPEVRSFIALPSSDELRSALAETVRRLSESRADVRWERDDKFHVTLKFLGNVEMAKLEELAAALAAEIGSVGELDLVYEGLGAFPSRERPRIVWAGVREHERLCALQATIEAICTRLGAGTPEDRPFHPHITLGRVKSDRGCDRLTAILKSITLQPVSARCSHILLMRSELHPTGSRYTALKSIPLTS